MRKVIAFMLTVLLLTVPVWADETEETREEVREAQEIYTVEDLYAIQEDPSESYVLMEDLDMAGQTWVPFAFSGDLDGQGHSILNLELSEPGAELFTAVDGSQKEYDAVYCGLFSALINAEVRNLNLLDVHGVIQSAQPCLAGPIAGYCMDSTVTGCSVTGRLELRACNSMIGLGGLVGYGVGDLVDCKTDVTLVCVDTDESAMDSQFLGGAYGAGFMTVQSCDIKLDAYISEYGYVHSGGVAGMLMQYPIAMGRSALITGNRISAKISFFEHSDRYHGNCGKVYGDLRTSVNFNYRIVDNDAALTRNETTDYSKALRPETCEKPNYQKDVVPADCTHFGYTRYVCQGCGYTYLADYQLHTHHSVSDWKVVKPATQEETGESIGKCDVCGAEETRIDPVLPEPETETEPETEPETQPETVPETEAVTEAPTEAETEPEPETVPETVPPDTTSLDGRPFFHPFWVLGLIAIILAILIWHMLAYKPQHAKRRKKKKKT